MFAAVREAAGIGEDSFDSETLTELLGEASSRYGKAFETLLPFLKVAINGTLVDADGEFSLSTRDVVALLPPVSGGNPQGDGRPRHRR